MFNIFNIFKTENEVIIELEAEVKALKGALSDCSKKFKSSSDSSAKTFGHYIDISLAFASEKVRADNLEKELERLKAEVAKGK